MLSAGCTRRLTSTPRLRTPAMDRSTLVRGHGLGDRPVPAPRPPRSGRRGSQCNVRPANGHPTAPRRRPGAVRLTRRWRPGRVRTVAHARLGRRPPRRGVSRWRRWPTTRRWRRARSPGGSETTGTTPLQWLLTQRVLLAQRLLETTTLPMQRCGFGTGAATMRRHFGSLRRLQPALPASPSPAVGYVSASSDSGGGQ